MPECTTIDNPRPSLGLIVHHTDAEREYTYDAKPKSSGKLVTALEAAENYLAITKDIAKYTTLGFANWANAGFALMEQDGYYFGN